MKQRRWGKDGTTARWREKREQISPQSENISGDEELEEATKTTWSWSLLLEDGPGWAWRSWQHPPRAPPGGRATDRPGHQIHQSTFTEVTLERAGTPSTSTSFHGNPISWRVEAVTAWSCNQSCGLVGSPGGKSLKKERSRPSETNSGSLTN